MPWRRSFTVASHAGDIAAQTAACVREIREATKALNPIKTKLRAFEGMKVSVPGGRVAIGVSKEAVYGYAIFVDRGVWNKLDGETHTRRQMKWPTKAPPSSARSRARRSSRPGPS